MPTSKNRPAATSPPKRPSHGRLWAEERRKQLLAVASKLLSEEGVEAVRIPNVAQAAGVTRPVVYKHFENRNALLAELLGDFGDQLQARLTQAYANHSDNLYFTLEEAMFALCETIEEHGAGPWFLITGNTPDPEISAITLALREELVAPWLADIQTTLRISERETFVLSQMILANMRSLILLWKQSQLTRDEAVENMMRSVGAILREYSN